MTTSENGVGGDGEVESIDPSQAANAAAARRFKWFIFIPLTVFLMLAALFYTRLTSGVDLKAIPSALINKPAPEFTLAPLAGLTSTGKQIPGLSEKDVETGVSVVNVWASWCGPCRTEHPVLMELAKDTRFKVLGINYKDKAENARRFLGTLGNPYSAVGVDDTGRTGIDWGVYGVPETFVVANGTILFKYIGPISKEGFSKQLMPALEKALTDK